jgi:hypothetical protein
MAKQLAFDDLLAALMISHCARAQTFPVQLLGGQGWHKATPHQSDPTAGRLRTGHSDPLCENSELNMLKEFFQGQGCSTIFLQNYILVNVHSFRTEVLVMS